MIYPFLVGYSAIAGCLRLSSVGARAIWRQEGGGVGGGGCRCHWQLKFLLLGLRVIHVFTKLMEICFRLTTREASAPTSWGVESPRWDSMSWQKKIRGNVRVTQPDEICLIRRKAASARCQSSAFFFPPPNPISSTAKNARHFTTSAVT